MAYRSAVDPDFWALFNALPSSTRTLAEEQKMIFEADNDHPSLKFKLLCRKFNMDLYSARVDGGHRVLGYPAMINGIKAIKWFWIGAHDEYDRLRKMYCSA